MCTDWVSPLLDWYKRHKRVMPWRDQPDPYLVWVSEIMLQQTQVETVRPYFNRFVALFPNVQALAAASSDEVLKAWEGLGYYRRIGNLHAAARRVAAAPDGMPLCYEQLRQLPGIGAYTAAAIASIAYGESVAVIDGNVRRVFARFLGMDEDIATAGFERRLQRYLNEHIARETPGDFNQAVMELGALLCKPRNPECNVCPLRTCGCVAFAADRVAELPVRRKKPALPQRTHVCGLLLRDHRVLVAQRHAKEMLGGLWEFPGGACNQGEPAQQALTRLLRVRAGIDVEKIDKLRMIRHVYSHFKLELHAYRVMTWQDVAAASDYAQVKWIAISDLEQLAFHGVNRPLLGDLRTAQ